jgi:hypothetical protein
MKYSNKLLRSVVVFPAVLISVNCHVFSASAQREGESLDTCAGLQAVANRVYAKHKISFQGFERLPMQTDVYNFKDKGTDRLCQLGYMTETTPMGKQICKAHMYTNIKEERMRIGVGYHRNSLFSPVNREADFCRYID